MEEDYACIPLYCPQKKPYTLYPVLQTLHPKPDIFQPKPSTKEDYACSPLHCPQKKRCR
eukprot:CAMPEP_0173130608 /NCGR_PEP_ID=MMETSP1102-20130122/60141_1 /TAXON_ID=49646 /ORGANISM="Geminigera sp., Strain Caron Lab Isolate" /LENGTH=58 /DNA_ID=CAMNT_0014041755 /DNA_START=374 /DNA_END=550 /DNA_ORIENTATION=-